MIIAIKLNDTKQSTAGTEIETPEKRFRPLGRADRIGMTPIYHRVNPIMHSHPMCQAPVYSFQNVTIVTYVRGSIQSSTKWWPWQLLATLRPIATIASPATFFFWTFILITKIYFYIPIFIGVVYVFTYVTGAIHNIINRWISALRCKLRLKIPLITLAYFRRSVSVVASI